MSGSKPGSVVRCLRDGHKGRVRSLVFHTLSADLLCSLADDSLVCIWSMMGGNCLQVLQGGGGQVMAVSCMAGHRTHPTRLPNPG
jgi:WD40 repeat protein